MDPEDARDKLWVLNGKPGEPGVERSFVVFSIPEPPALPPAPIVDAPTERLPFRLGTAPEPATGE
jgi:hypothetical protein